MRCKLLISNKDFFKFCVKPQKYSFLEVLKLFLRNDEADRKNLTPNGK